MPKRAIANWSPIARAIFLPLNHFAMERVTDTPAISLPRPNSMQPKYAIIRDVLGSKPADMAKVTSAAPPTIIPTNMDPTSLTPNLSSRAPHTISPPQMQRKEYPLE